MANIRALKCNHRVHKTFHRWLRVLMWFPHAICNNNWVHIQWIANSRDGEYQQYQQLQQQYNESNIITTTATTYSLTTFRESNWQFFNRNANKLFRRFLLRYRWMDVVGVIPRIHCQSSNVSPKMKPIINTQQRSPTKALANVNISNKLMHCVIYSRSISIGMLRT